MSSPQTAAPARSLQVARIAGVPVYIGASWLLLAGFIVIVTGSSLVGAVGPIAYAVGAGYALGLLLAVLVHEGAHAVAARRLGLPVHRVVANLWGGHTAYDSTRSTPGRSALIAVVGPLANLALAGLAHAAAQLVIGPAAGVLAMLAIINALLGAFNLLPGLPLDGGQLVDAAVWGATGRRDAGLIAAGWCGRVVVVLVLAWVLLVPSLQGRTPRLDSALWMLLIAMFMWQGAGGAIRHGKARRMLRRAPRLGAVAEPVAVLDPATPLRTALHAGGHVVTLDERGLPVLVFMPGEIHGIESLPADTPVRAMLNRIPDDSVVEADPGDDLLAVVQAMQSTRSRLAVLTSEGRPWGLARAAAVNAALGEN